ncbi:MAG: hypothetical protein AAB401_05220, partial [Acidobacteriota bacterium]
LTRRQDAEINLLSAHNCKAQLGEYLALVAPLLFKASSLLKRGNLQHFAESVTANLFADARESAVRVSMY